MSSCNPVKKSSFNWLNGYPTATIREALPRAAAFLEQRGVADARLSAEWLFGRALGCGRASLHLRRDEHLPADTRRDLERQLGRLAAHEPLQYVQGDTEFMGHVFAADRRALIPRPETEELVEAVLARGELWRASPAIADVGTGSGCIAVSLAVARPEGRYCAVDVAPAALELARENARRHGVLDRIRFVAGNLLDNQAPGGLDAVVSNPPYVRSRDWAALPPMIREYEPRLALDGGPDGLAVIRPLIAQSARALKPGGLLLMEIGAGQAAAVQGLLRESGFADIAVHPDLAGKDRIAIAQWWGEPSR